MQQVPYLMTSLMSRTEFSVTSPFILRPPYRASTVIPPILAPPYTFLKAFHRLGAVEADCRQQHLQERASVSLCEKSSSGPIRDWSDDQLRP